MSRLLVRCTLSGLATNASMASSRCCARSASRSSRQRWHRKSPSLRVYQGEMTHAGIHWEPVGGCRSLLPPTVGVPAVRRNACPPTRSHRARFWRGRVGATVADETRFILSTFSFLLWGALVMWMCAGFTMLEAGSVRTKNASVVCLKNVGLYAIAGLAFYLVGYQMMFVGIEPGGWFSAPALGFGSTEAERAMLAGRAGTTGKVVATGHAAMSHWFFQMVFVASTASIVSGTLAERSAAVVVLPVRRAPDRGSSIPSWVPGPGEAAGSGALGFRDFAGSTVVHSTGGWAALAGVLVVGARRGKFRADGSVLATPPSQRARGDAGRVHASGWGFSASTGGSWLALGGALECRRGQYRHHEHLSRRRGRRHDSTCAVACRPSAARTCARR